MMSCNFLDEHIIAMYIDNLLDEDKKREIDIHLDKCNICLAKILEAKRVMFKVSKVPYRLQSLQAINSIGVKIRDSVKLIREFCSLLPVAYQSFAMRGDSKIKESAVTFKLEDSLITIVGSKGGFYDIKVKATNKQKTILYKEVKGKMFLHEVISFRGNYVVFDTISRGKYKLNIDGEECAIILE